jgi:hypothetical protein
VYLVKASDHRYGSFSRPGPIAALTLGKSMRGKHTYGGEYDCSTPKATAESSLRFSHFQFLLFFTLAEKMLPRRRLTLQFLKILRNDNLATAPKRRNAGKFDSHPYS